jgi:hypothetical protein
MSQKGKQENRKFVEEQKERRNIEVSSFER